MIIIIIKTFIFILFSIFTLTLCKSNLLNLSFILNYNLLRASRWNTLRKHIIHFLDILFSKLVTHHLPNLYDFGINIMNLLVQSLNLAIHGPHDVLPTLKVHLLLLALKWHMLHARFVWFDNQIFHFLLKNLQSRVLIGLTTQ